MADLANEEKPAIAPPVFVFQKDKAQKSPAEQKALSDTGEDPQAEVEPPYHDLGHTEPAGECNSEHPAPAVASVSATLSPASEAQLAPIQQELAGRSADGSSPEDGDESDREDGSYCPPVKRERTSSLTQFPPQSVTKNNVFMPSSFCEPSTGNSDSEPEEKSSGFRLKPPILIHGQAPSAVSCWFCFQASTYFFAPTMGHKVLRKIDSLLQKSSIGPHFTGCNVTGFRPGKNRESTGVDIICSYGKGSQVPKFNPAEVYQELRRMTSGITKLGIYSLDNTSLYVNGYNELLERSPQSTTAAPEPTSRNFTLNFTLTNLRYIADLDATNSRRFLSTVKVMNYYLDPLFKRSSISSAYTGCKAMRFRSGRHGDDTKVDAVCSYKDNASPARFDREKLYQELSTMTNNVTKLGHYSLDRSSLYVDGFTLTDTAATKKPLSTAATLGYRLSFRIVNENLTNPDSQSPEYKAAVESITNKINHLYQQSDLRDQFLICRITGLRLGSIVVDCQCFFQPNPNINRAVVERTFQHRTSNSTGLWLGSSYRLQEFSVDNLELSVEAATHKTPLESGKENFRLNFQISNLPYSPELQDSSSQMYQENKEKIEKELEVFRTSYLKDQFVGCTVESFGPVRGKGHTEVTSVCRFTPDPLSGTLQEQEVFEELKLLTQGFTRLGPSYELEQQSLVVEGYSPLKTDEPESKRSGLQFWAIILICLFALLGFTLLLLLCLLVLSCLRRKSHLYQVQQGLYGMYFPHLSTGKVH